MSLPVINTNTIIAPNIDANPNQKTTIINVLLVVILFILFFSLIIYLGKYKCPSPDITINYARATILEYDTNLNGLRTIKLKLDRSIPCGMYSLKTIYGDGVIFVPNRNDQICYLHKYDMDTLLKIKLIDLWNIRRLQSKSPDDYISTYNNSCC